MKLKRFSLEEKKKFFEHSAWGAESDYNGFYYDDGYPERHIILNLTNDELIQKYLEWVDAHMDADAKKKYLGGYALHCRFEMGRRLREGIEKFEKHDDDLFNKAFSVFQDYFQICVKKRGAELRKRIQELTKQEYSLNKNLIDSIYVRLTPYKEHGENIGKDFLSMFDKYIEPRCDRISFNSEGILYSRLTLIYSGLINNADREIKTIIASRGRKAEEAKSYILVSNGYYSAANTNCRDELNARIKDHNFLIENKRESRNELKIVPSTEIVHRNIKKRRFIQKGSTAKKSNKRKRRTKVELESLTPKVVEAYQNLLFEGQHTWKQIFKKLEQDSKLLFGKHIPSGSLQGIYNRRKNHS